MIRQAIKVMHSSNFKTIFVIEGFEVKHTSIDLIESKVLEFYERLYGLGGVVIKRSGVDFVVSTNGYNFYITWSWVTSFMK